MARFNKYFGKSAEETTNRKDRMTNNRIVEGSNDRTMISSAIDLYRSYSYYFGETASI